MYPLYRTCILPIAKAKTAIVAGSGAPPALLDTTPAFFGGPLLLTVVEDDILGLDWPDTRLVSTSPSGIQPFLDAVNRTLLGPLEVDEGLLAPQITERDR